MRSPTAGMRVVVVSVILLLLAFTPAAAQEYLAITPVTVVDVTDGSLVHDQTVLVAGNRIRAVQPADEVSVPDGATLVDGTGGYLIPGLWDMHTHLLWSTDATEHYWTEMPEDVDSWTLWERYYGPALDLLIANGVTGIREMWGNLDVARRVRQEEAAGERLAPRMVVAGQEVGGPPPEYPGMVVVATPDEARDAVDSLAAAGAAFIKVQNRVRPEVFQAIVQRTQEIGLPLAGHVPWLVRAADASDAGQRSIEHLTGIPKGCSSIEADLMETDRAVVDAVATGNTATADSLEHEWYVRLLSTQDDSRCRVLLDLLARNGTWQVPTLAMLRGEIRARDPAARRDPRLRYIHPGWRASWLSEGDASYPERREDRRRFNRRKMEIVGMMSEAGVPIMAGSDTPLAFAFPGFGLHDEMELLVEFRFTPLEALQAATINPARFLGAADSLGTVEEGKMADLVLLKANPLEDIRHTQRITAVVLDGHVLRRDDLNALLERVEQVFAAADD